MSDTAEVAAAPAGPHGIGGWLIIPLLGFVGTILLTVFNMIQPDAIEGFRIIFTSDEEAVKNLQVPMGISVLFALAVIGTVLFGIALARFRKTIGSMA